MLTTLLLLLALLFALPAMADDNINFTLSVAAFQPHRTRPRYGVGARG